MSVNELKKLNLKTIVITTILSAFAFLVALSWRDAIQRTLDEFLPQGEGLYYQYLTALVVTMIAIAVTYSLLRLQNRDLIPGKIEKKIGNRKKSAKK
ncbi:hypothetical protein KAI12_05490 [Candidatus Bathyarchaeota archaeon]|nr:hypothetical protein [Candidatus Bathyarchaeota archaeon]